MFRMLRRRVEAHERPFAPLEFFSPGREPSFCAGDRCDRRDYEENLSSEGRQAGVTGVTEIAL